MKCKLCKKRKSNFSGLCGKCYYKINKNRILENQKIYRKKTFNKRLLKKFGFIPKIHLYNKGVTSDGCFLGNSKLVLRHFNNQDTLGNYRRKHSKAMWVYQLGKNRFKIQIADVVTKEEFWVKFNGIPDRLVKFFNKLKGHPISCIKNWDKEEK